MNHRSEAVRNHVGNDPVQTVIDTLQDFGHETRDYADIAPVVWCIVSDQWFQMFRTISTGLYALNIIEPEVMNLWADNIALGIAFNVRALGPEYVWTSDILTDEQ